MGFHGAWAVFEAVIELAFELVTVLVVDLALAVEVSFQELALVGQLLPSRDQYPMALGVTILEIPLIGIPILIQYLALAADLALPELPLVDIPIRVNQFAMAMLLLVLEAALIGHVFA